MSREIKFRLPFFNSNGSFSHFGYWGTIDHKGEPSLDHGCFTSPSSSGLRKGWHEQFTGLKDKKGNDIYEGDIVSNDEYPNQEAPIVFDNGMFSFEGEKIPFSLDSEGMNYATDEVLEIIGNIHDNHELIK